MYFYLIGINYKTTPFLRREFFWRNFAKIAEFWQIQAPQEAVLLSTCNRIEVYGVSDSADAAFAKIKQFKFAHPDFFNQAYVKYTQKEVLLYSLRLATGLESQLEGESQISGQLKRWILQPNFPFALKDLLSRAIFLSHVIRRRAGLESGVSNLAEIVFRDLGRFINSQQSARIIVLGTGKIAELLVLSRPLPWKLQFVAHKNFAKAAYLAKKAGTEVFSFKDLPDLLRDADGLISATSSPHYILKKSDFLNLSASRKAPLFIYDLAMPRDIEPEAARNHKIFLQDMDDLAVVFKQYNQQISWRIKIAENLIKQALESEELVANGRID